MGAGGEPAGAPKGRGALATVCSCHPVCFPSSSRSRSSRSRAATGPGSDSTGSTAGHTADTGYSWAEGKSVQWGVAAGCKGLGCSPRSSRSCRQGVVAVVGVAVRSPDCSCPGCRVVGCNSAVGACSC